MLGSTFLVDCCNLKFTFILFLKSDLSLYVHEQIRVVAHEIRMTEFEMVLQRLNHLQCLISDQNNLIRLGSGQPALVERRHFAKAV